MNPQCLRVALLFLLALTMVHRTLAAQTNFDFEEGLRGWTKSGSAFDRPMRGDEFRTNASLPPRNIGGDYWQHVLRPVGHHGNHFLSSYSEREGDAARGTLTSDVFILAPEHRYFSFLIGGGQDVEHEYLALQVESGDGYQTVVRATGRDADPMQREVHEIPASLAGKRARILIVDDSSGPRGHINVDDIRLTPARPSEVESSGSPVWGFADYHTHPMNTLGFGGLKGVHTVSGNPGGAYKDYDPAHGGQRSVSDDIPHCVARHGGSVMAEPFINTVESRIHSTAPLALLWAWITARLTTHKRSGGPEFADFPSFLSGAHEQMHITQIHRAWEGGLRLMTAIAVHNRGAEYLVSELANYPPSTERQVLKAQIDAMRLLAQENCDWMEIAETPEDARRIIREDKLAVIQAVEMDQLGELGFPTMKEEVDYLWGVGIRQVTPVHAVDNATGSAAVFQPFYNSLNDLLNRPHFRRTAKELKNGQERESFFNVKEGGCGIGSPLEGQFGECVQFRLKSPQARVAEKTVFPISPFHNVPFPVDTPVERYKCGDGHMNQCGLRDGGAYISLLMDRGILVDLAHMSQQTVEDIWKLVGARLVRQGHRGCAAFGFRDDLPESCYKNAPPLNVTHVHFRGPALLRGETRVDGFVPSEYFVSDRQAKVVARTEGILGPFVTANPVKDSAAKMSNDCAMSSKSFGNAYLYGLDHAAGAHVGFATDYTFIPAVSPRFGPNACWAYHFSSSPRWEKTHSGQYKFQDQRDRVVYTGSNGLTPYRMDLHTYDFNTEGLANYGLLPDFLQDLKNEGLPQRAFDALFSSAEGYLRTWEKARRAACTTGDCAVLLEGLSCGPLPRLSRGYKVE